MAVEERVDWRIAAEGALLTLAVVLPPLVIVLVLNSRDIPGEESNLWVFVVLALLGGFTAGGYSAGKRVQSSPLLHAAAAGGLAFAVLIVISMVRRAVGGHGVSLARVMQQLLLAQILVSCALLGGYVATRRAHRT